MSRKVLLVGCGQLGSRHLQALVCVDTVTQIVVVDPYPASLELGRRRVEEVPSRRRDMQISWVNTVGTEAKGADLCVLATQARGRGALLQEVAQKTGCRNFLIEKVVAQSVAEYEDMLAFVRRHDLRVWVNCKTRAYRIHRYIKSRLNPAEAMTFTAIGGNHGLGNNGVHEADIFVFHDGCSELSLQGQKLSERLSPSKRGPEVMDLGGILFGVSDKGSEFIVSFSDAHNSPDMITITTPSARFVVDHLARFAMESYPADNWVWKPVVLDENWAVSHMTKDFAEQIMEKGVCLLPTLEECFPAHKFILGSLYPQFSRLAGCRDGVCPIT
ncbi:MAG: Gfo/Idh/MocA family oxidoreductase [Candidatus Omnitrophica bacterium]|nr:Gfo/Idh/MocA family oxidoreductase [Candidatus Omnitrophota bacterium]